MSIDIFGRAAYRTNDIKYIKGVPGAPGIGFKLTGDNQFDINRKRLYNIAAPIDESDAATLSRTRSSIKHETERILKLITNIESTVHQCTAEVKTLRDIVDKLSNREKPIAELKENISTLQLFFEEQLTVNNKIQNQQQILTEKLMSDWHTLADIQGRLTKLER